MAPASRFGPIRPGFDSRHVHIRPSPGAADYSRSARAIVTAAMPSVMTDVAVGIIGATIALAAVLVVFMGFLIAHAEGLASTAPIALTEKYMRAAKAGLVPTTLAVIEALLAYLWLMTEDDYVFYLWSFGFVVVVLVFLIYAIVAVRMI
jgi:hypothetical protein